MPERPLGDRKLANGRPSLVFFHSSVSGWAIRVDGFLANVLQRRRNHDTFKLLRVALEEYPDLAERFAVGRDPTLLVIEDKKVVARLENPRGSREIEAFLAPWLRRRSRGAGDARATPASGALASATTPARPESA